MRVTITFQLKKGGPRSGGLRPVYLRVTLYRKRVELSTRIRVDPKTWDAKGQRVKGKSQDTKVTNSRLGKIYSNVLDTFNRMEAAAKEFDVYDLKNQLCGISDDHSILGMFNYYIATIESKLGKGYALRTFVQYKTTRKRLSEFIETAYRRSDVSLGFIDYSFLNAFDVYLKQKHKNNQNTAWGYHKHMKKILNLSMVMYYLKYLNFRHLI